jgi:hypothetical protein
MNKCSVFLQFLNKGSTEIFSYLFSSALPISLNFPFICVIIFFLSFRAIFCFNNTDYRLIWMTSPPVNPDWPGFTVHLAYTKI